MSKLVLDPAAQIILHPAMNASLKVLGTTVGRDKLYRFVQYYSRLLAWVYLQRGDKVNAARWDGLKGSFSNARKILRLFKFVEHLQSALKLAQHAAPGDWVSVTQCARQIGYVGFLFFDSVHWAHTTKLVTLSPSSAQLANKLSMRFWVAGISLSIINGFQRFSQIRTERRKLRSRPSAQQEKDLNPSSEAERKIRLQTLKAEYVAVRYQFVQDVLDWWIPASNLGIVNPSEGVLGLFGSVTSAIGFYLQWVKVNGGK